MTQRSLMAATSLAFVLGLAACAPTSPPPPPADPPLADEPFGASPEPMEDDGFQDDMDAPMPID